MSEVPSSLEICYDQWPRLPECTLRETSYRWIYYSYGAHLKKFNNIVDYFSFDSQASKDEMCPFEERYQIDDFSTIYFKYLKAKNPYNCCI